MVKRMKDIKAQLDSPTTDENDIEHREALLEELLIIVEDIDCAKGAHTSTPPLRDFGSLSPHEVQIGNTLLHASEICSRLIAY